MEYTYILAVENEQNQAVFDNILNMFPELRTSERYREGLYHKEPGDVPPEIFHGAKYLLIKAESESYDPALLAGTIGALVYPDPGGAKNVRLNFWTW